MFHLIKDSININQDYSQIELICFSCQRKGHMARDCDKIHFVPDRAEVIKTHLERLKTLRKKFQRNNTRSKFRALANLIHMEQAAQMVQEDYSDFTLSDEELSQDSLDVILEKNLIILPGQELNDLKARKTERRNKSQRYSQQFFMGEMGATSPITVAQRLSQFSHTVREDSEARTSMKITPSDIVFFSIDKVENFEVYYPQFNIRTMIQKFEKDRVQQMLKGTKGGAKMLVLKNFGSMLRDKNRRGTIMPPGSPVYFARSSYEKKQTLQRGRKTLKNHQEMPDTSLKNQMQKALVKAKTLKKQQTLRKTGKTFEEDGFDSNNNYSTPVDSAVEKTPLDIINESFKKRFSSDEATMSRKETHDDKKTLRQKQRVFNFETLSPHTMGQLKLDRSDTQTHSQALPSSTRMLGPPESPAQFPNFPRKSKTKESSKKGTIIQHLLTRQSLEERITLADFAGVGNDEIEHALLHALIKEEYAAANTNAPSSSKSLKKAKKGRAYSLEKLDEMKKAIAKFKMPKILRGLMETGPVNTRTAHFGI